MIFGFFLPTCSYIHAHHVLIRIFFTFFFVPLLSIFSSLFRLQLSWHCYCEILKLFLYPITSSSIHFLNLIKIYHRTVRRRHKDTIKLFFTFNYIYTSASYFCEQDSLENKFYLLFCILNMCSIESEIAFSKSFFPRVLYSLRLMLDAYRTMYIKKLEQPLNDDKRWATEEG